MLNKFFGITLSVVLALGSQVLFAQAQTLVELEGFGKALSEVVTPELATKFVDSGAQLSALSVTEASAIVTGLAKLSVNEPSLKASIETYIDSCSKKVQDDFNAALETVSTDVKETAKTTNIEGQENAATEGQVEILNTSVKVDNGAVDTKYIVEHVKDISSAKSLSVGGVQVTDGPVFNKIVGRFNDVMDVAVAVEDAAVQAKDVGATVRYFENSNLFAVMTDEGEKFMIDTINGYNGTVSQATTADNLDRYSKNLDPKALTCLATATAN